MVDSIPLLLPLSLRLHTMPFSRCYFIKLEYLQNKNSIKMNENTNRGKKRANSVLKGITRQNVDCKAYDERMACRWCTANCVRTKFSRFVLVRVCVVRVASQVRNVSQSYRVQQQ